MNIEWKEGEVCFADDTKWFYYDGNYLINTSNRLRTYRNLVNINDFKLNEIRQGNYIPASELDTEKKCNDAVKFFELFGFNPYLNCGMDKLEFIQVACKEGLGLIVDRESDLVIYYQAYQDKEAKKRKLTCPQLMAIGELKRMMNEPKQSEQSSAITEPTKTASDYLSECISVQKQRGEQYDSKGTGERSFDAAARAFNALTGGNLKGSDVCLLLTCVKAVRQYSNPERLHDDSLLDGVSYLSLWAEELNKELK